MSTVSAGYTQDIVALAVDYHRSPLKYRSLVLPTTELPDDAGKLLHVACGDDTLLAELSHKIQLTPSQIKTAAEFFIRQAFFARDADYYRVLGLRKIDGIERIKEHHRLLMKLFHPDRGDTEGAWTDALATRVNQAYTVLRKPESRREYDASLRVSKPAATGQVEGTRPHWARVPRPRFGASVEGLSPSVRRHFPEFVLGGIGTLAALVVGALYLFEEPSLSGSGAIGGLAISAPVNVVSTRATAAPSPENTRAGANRGDQPVESVASPSAPANTGPLSPVAVAPEAPATNESTAAMASDTPISVPAASEPVAAKTIAPSVAVVEAGRTTIAPPAVPLTTETVKPVTVATARATVATSEVKTRVPEKTPAGKVDARSAPAPAPATARTAPNKAGVQEARARAEVISPPPPVPARTTVKTVVASTAPTSVVMTATSPAPRAIVSDLALDRLIGRFIGSYEQGDIDRFMVLFHEDTKTGDKKSNKAMTRKEYIDLFSSTQVRQMMLQDFRWEKGEDLVRGQGRFLARAAGQGDAHVREYAGSIRMEVANVDGHLLIVGLFHSIETKKNILRGTDASGLGGK